MGHQHSLPWGCVGLSLLPPRLCPKRPIERREIEIICRCGSSGSRAPWLGERRLLNPWRPLGMLEPFCAMFVGRLLGLGRPMVRTSISLGGL